MTSAEYNRIREMIESTFRLDMGALERVWFRVNGCNPPDSPVALAAPREEAADVRMPGGGSTGLRSAESMGIQSAARISAMHQGGREPRKKKFGSSRKLGWAKYRAKKAGKDPETMTEEQLQEFMK